jgi:26S proteasome non-ATPase regulatory subunit 10
MKHLLLTTIAAVVLVGCGTSAPDVSIHDAAEEGNIKAVKQHLAAGTDVDAKDMNGETPLNWATYNGHKEIVELLIAAGADMNVKDHVWGYTPLHRAAFSGHKEIAELLIANGADVNATDKYGETPLGETQRYEIADLLRKHGGKRGRR